MRLALLASTALATVSVAASGCASSPVDLPPDDPVSRIRQSKKSAAEKIRDLRSLKDRGVVSAADYEWLRKELVEGL